MPVVCFLFIIFFFQSGYAYSAGFDCDKAIARIDKAICADMQINTADEVMSSLYFKIASRIDKKSKKKLLRGQRLWLKQRNVSCKNLSPQCLRLVYSGRIGELLTKYERFIFLTPNELDHIAKEFPFHSDWVGVYFVRDEDEGDLDIPITMDLNNKVIGQTIPRTFFWYRLKPSDDDRYWFGSFAEKICSMGLRVPFGNKYYFVEQHVEQTEKNGQKGLSGTFRSIKEDVGMKKVLESKIIVANDVGKNIAPTSDPKIYNKPCPPDLLQKINEVSSKFNEGEISQVQWASEHKLLLEQCQAGSVSK